MLLNGRLAIGQIRFYQLLNRTFADDYDPEDDIGEPFPSNCVTTRDEINMTRFIADGGVPRFHGLKRVPIDGKEEEFLILDDLTCPFSRPAIMDVKMGRVTYDPDASDKKVKSETEKYPPQKSLGFRLLGYRIHKEDGSVEIQDKDWGKSKDETNIGQALLEYFTIRPDAVALILRKATLFREWFAQQRLFHFYASSLLFIFETDPTKPVNADVRMIDFGHVYPGNEQLDDNYTHGLDNLISLLEEMLLKT
ncbi:unnamed protein product, partial [Mesorhabditis belari]|uniref:Kinase n=1 Tax=Mesorhabditis belari TaxID=2138241 RepID=A0AAF3J824_9BILA